MDTKSTCPEEHTDVCGSSILIIFVERNNRNYFEEKMPVQRRVSLYFAAKDNKIISEN